MTYKHFDRSRPTRVLINKRGAVSWIAIWLLLTLAACATYPTQEMSDARQAVRAAEEIGADKHLPEIYNKAALLLSIAESELQTTSPHYSSAKTKALAAKNEAVKARHLTVALIEAEKTITKLTTPETKLTEAIQALENAHAAIKDGAYDDAMRLCELAKSLAIQGR